MKSLFLVLTILISFYSHACINGKGYLPENNLRIPVGAKNIGGVTQTDFNDVIDKVIEVYKPIVKSKGGNLKVNRLWDDGTVNAKAYRQGSNYMVDMFGGLARHQSMTKDGFALVACHEVGHHIGGAPVYSGAGMTWASTEGQSDYFAVTKCLRKIMEDDQNEDIIANMNVDPTARDKCDDQFSNANESALCQRISMAGFASSSLFAAMNNSTLPRFDSPDPAVVSKTYESHPKYQCRLDTYFQGASCTVDHTTDVDQRDPNIGACNRPDGFDEGLRPLCWYKPTGGGTNPPTNPPNPPNPPNPNPGEIAKTPTVNGSTSVVINRPSDQVPIAIDV